MMHGGVLGRWPFWIAFCVILAFGGALSSGKALAQRDGVGRRAAGTNPPSAPAADAPTASDQDADDDDDDDADDTSSDRDQSSGNDAPKPATRPVESDLTDPNRPSGNPSAASPPAATPSAPATPQAPQAGSSPTGASAVRSGAGSTAGAAESAATAGDTASGGIGAGVGGAGLALGLSKSERIFGTYRVRLSYAQPRFDDGLKFNEKLYGPGRWYPSIGADWFAFDWYATLGLSFRMGYYAADGHAAKDVGKTPKEMTKDDVEPDLNSPTTLTLIPLQACLAAEFTPFSKKWVVFDGWIGIERLYWQEVRAASSVDSSPKAMMSLAETTSTADDVYTNKGWKNASVIGFAGNILLNGLDEKSAASMRHTLGLGQIYFSPFVEIVRTMGKEGASFGRSIYGLAFTFESVK